MSTTHMGRRVEDFVASYLCRQGLVEIERNPVGANAEIDLVFGDRVDCEDMVVFVEVRSRHSASLVAPVETVDRRKQRQIIRAATSWLIRRGLWERVAVRFDVVGVTGSIDDAEVEWLQAAFEQH